MASDTDPIAAERTLAPASAAIARPVHERETTRGIRADAKAIARAIIVGPGLLLLDEPTATRDRVAAAAIAELAVTLGATLTVIVATHDPALVSAADTVLDLAASGIA